MSDGLTDWREDYWKLKKELNLFKLQVKKLKCVIKKLENECNRLKNKNQLELKLK